MAAEEIMKAVKTLFSPGEVIEIRFKLQDKWQSGYYDYEHFDQLVKDVLKFDELKEVKAIYNTLNPVQPILLARAKNRIQRAKETTTDEQILYRKYLPFDIDPERPAGVSSTDEGHEKSIEKAYQIKEFLKEKGLPDPIIGDSGNGAHIMYRINEPNTPEVKQLITDVQTVVCDALNNPEDKIKIEPWANAGRIWKTYGTSTKKGDEIPEEGIRHRRSKLLEVPAESQTVTTEQLRVVAGLKGNHYIGKGNANEIVSLASVSEDSANKNRNIFDIVGFMDKHKIEVVRTKKERDKTIYVLESCPINPEHTGNKEAVITQEDNGKLGFKCHHNSCADKHWNDVREKFEPGYQNKRNKQFDELSLSDWGNAQRLINNYGSNLRYCHEVKDWYIWDNTRWKQDLEGKIYQFAKKTVEGLYSILPNIHDPDVRKKIFSFILKSENQSKIKSMVESATNEPGIPISFTEFDKNLDYINVSNGIVDLRNNKLLPHEKNQLITKKIEFNYNPAAECPRFIKFLNEILPKNPEIISFLKRFFGYSLTGQTSEQVFCIFHGHGNNGKGTLIDTIMNVMGEYAQATEPETIVKKKNERSNTNDLAVLKGARFVTTSETEANAILDEGRIKRITGQDLITCRLLYQEYFTYIPEYKLILLTNHEPIIQAQDYSIWRRVLKIPFNVKFLKENWDLKLRSTLLSESEGILNWMIQGAREWYEKGLEVPESITLATEEYKQELDILGDFIEVCTNSDSTKKESISILYKFYKNWAEVTENYVMSKTAFSKRLDEREFKNSKSNGIRYKNGIEIKASLREIGDVRNYIKHCENVSIAAEEVLKGHKSDPLRKVLLNTSPMGTFHEMKKSDPVLSTDSDSKNEKRPLEKNSQSDIGKKTMEIINSWYTEKPKNPSESKNYIIPELVRVTGITPEAAFKHVTNAFRVKGWS